MAVIPEYPGTGFISNLPDELANNIGVYFERGNPFQDDRLYRSFTRFREIVDAVMPSMLVIDKNAIRRELDKYKDIGRALSQDINKEAAATEKNIITALSVTQSEIDLILDAMDLIKGIINPKKITMAQLNDELRRIINDGMSSSTVISKFQSNLPNVYLISDAGGNKDIYLFPTFNKAVSSFNNAITAALGKLKTDTGRISQLGKSVGQILNLGHNAAGYVAENGDVNLQFNSPKLIGILIDMVNSSTNSEKQIKEAVTSFVDVTRQADTYVEVEKDFSQTTLKFFIAIGGSILAPENAIINQRKGSVLEASEKRGVSGTVIATLARVMKERSGLVGKIGKLIEKKIPKGRGSPSMLDYVAYALYTAIKGGPIAKFKGKDSATRTRNVKVKVPSLQGQIGSRAKIPRITVPYRAREAHSLADLERLLRLRLALQIRENMGTGNATRVLNYRTGRFAETATIESVVQNRAGMITVFYNYMRNPYATFGPGGRQQYPLSRDPSPLVAKSIRQIGASAAYYRMRTVLV